MVIYQYACPGCGPFDARYPMGEAPARRPCALCAGPAVRRFTPPLLSRTPRALAAARQAQEAGPRIVDRVPPARRRGGGRPAGPRHALLPRP